MAIEILPSTADGLEETVEKSWTPDRGTARTLRYSGPTSVIDDRWTELEAEATAGQLVGLTSLTSSTSRGRGTLTETYARTIGEGADPETEGVQELLGMEITRPWETAPYFSTLTQDDILDVRTAVENGDPVNPAWADLKKALYGHKVQLGDDYYATYYVFRRTYRASSEKVLKRAAADPNTVQDLPTLSKTLQNLIDALPSGEWLKKPIEVVSLGKDGWSVREEYVWAPEWSIAYEGSFTGL